MNTEKKNSALDVGLDRESLDKINALADTDSNGKTSFSELYRSFRLNSLSRLDSFYNALFIHALNKLTRGRKIKAQYQNLFRHPKGWFRDSEYLAARSIWNYILGLLLFVPVIALSITALPSKIANKLTSAGEGLESSAIAVKFIKSALPTLLLIIATLLTVSIIYHSNTKNPALELYVDGNLVGTVKNREVYYSALDIAEKNLSNMLGISYKIPDGTAYFKVKRTENPEYLSDSEISASLIKSSEKFLSIGYGLYIDETLVAVSSSRMIMDKILNETLTLYNNLYSATKKADDLISFANGVMIKEITVPKSIIRTEDEIRGILGLDGLSEVSDLLLRNKSVDNITVLDVSLMLPEIDIISSVDISAELPENNVYYIDSKNSDGAVITDSADSKTEIGDKSPGETMVLAFKTKETKTFTEIVPCDVKYVYDDTILEGRKIISVPGVDGIKRATYEVSYVGNKEVERVLLSETILKKSSVKTVIVGTRPASEYVGGANVTGTFIRPCEGTTTSTFSGRTIFGAYEFHSALDIAGRYGSTIMASDGGEVVFAGWNGSYGNCIIIDHGDGIESLYAHLSRYAVSKGDLVGQGWKIGEMGATGRVTGVHLHFEIRINGVKQDPEDYLE